MTNRSLGRPFTLLACFAAAFPVGCGTPPTTEPVRLLAAGSAVEVRGPAPELESSGSGPPAFARLPPERVGRIAMEGPDERFDARAALLAGDGTVFRFLVDLPAEPILRVGLGFRVPEEDAPSLGDVRFVASVGPVDANGVPLGAPETFLDETVAIAPQTAWRNREIPLPDLGGRRVALELATEVPEGQLAAWGVPEVVSRSGQEPGWNVLLISLDTLRADHLSCYGYTRPTSPHLDALAADGIRFAEAVSQAPWTRPSHRAILNGLYPISHGDLASPMLPTLLWGAGYRTTAITGGGQVDARFGFDEGVESFRIYQWVGAVAPVVEALREGRGRKQFLFLHTYRIHDPYEGDAFVDGLPSGRVGETFGKHDWYRFDKELTDEEKTYVEALYDSGIEVTDRSLGELFESLDHEGLLDRTIVVVTSDHGEQFWEHRTWRHGQVLYDHQVMVPLIMRLPPPLAEKLGVAPGTVIHRQVELVDLYPTLLDLVGVPLEHVTQGRSLVPLLTGEGLPPHDALAENTNVRDYERKMLRTERYKFIKSIPRASARDRGVTEPRYALFDLQKDPGEEHNLADRYPELVKILEQRLQAYHEKGTEIETELPEDIDPDLRERLRALGYLGDEGE